MLNEPTCICLTVSDLACLLGSFRLLAEYLLHSFKNHNFLFKWSGLNLTYYRFLDVGDVSPFDRWINYFMRSVVTGYWKKWLLSQIPPVAPSFRIFQSGGHVQCSESFYKGWIETEMSSRSSRFFSSHWCYNKISKIDCSSRVFSCSSNTCR